MKIRIIITSTENGDSEHVTFTEDDVSNATDFCYPHESVDCDKVCECDLPNGFPLEYALKRK